MSLPNAQIVEKVGMGYIVLTSGMVLRNVPCVPKFKCNLLLVSRRAKDSHIRAVFYDEFHTGMGNTSGQTDWQRE